jgi:hypothetical protein
VNNWRKVGDSVYNLNHIVRVLLSDDGSVIMIEKSSGTIDRYLIHRTGYQDALRLYHFLSTGEELSDELD